MNQEIHAVIESDRGPMVGVKCTLWVDDASDLDALGDVCDAIYDAFLARHRVSVRGLRLVHIRMTPPRPARTFLSFLRSILAPVKRKEA